MTTDKPFGIGTDRCSGVQLEPGGTCDVEIHVTPEEPGALAGLLQIWSTAVDLVEVRLKVTVEDVVPAFQVSPSVLEFDPVAVGQSMIRRVTVSVPAGFRAVPEVSASISGTDFKVREDGCLGALLKGGQMCEMEIAFQPTGVGLRTAALTLSAAAPCPPFQSQVPLKGIGQ